MVTDTDPIDPTAPDPAAPPDAAPAAPSTTSGKVAATSDFPTLTSLYGVALTAAKSSWGGKMYDDPPNWAANRIYVSKDAQGVRFGITTRDFLTDFWPPSRKEPLHLDEENWLFVGPRAGLSAGEMIAAVCECVRAWVNDCRARGKPDSWVIFGTVPETWNPNFLVIFTQKLACQQLHLPAGEWPTGGGGKMVVLYDTIGNWDARLLANGF